MASANLIFDIIARDKGASDTVDKIGAKFGASRDQVQKFKAGATVAFNVAGAAATAFLVQSVGNASDLAETLNKSQVVFGDQATAMEAWADTAATSVGLAKQQALAAASTFGDMFAQLGFTGDQAADMSQDVVKLAADLGSFHNVDTADVMDRISASLRGEYDSLQQLIPNINATRVANEAMAMTGKTNAAALTEQEKVAATLAIIHADGANAADDFAETSGSLANQQKVLQAQFADISAEVGTAFLPALTKVLAVGVQLLDWIKENKIATSILVGAIVAIVAVQWLWNAALAANPIGLIVIGIAALVAAFIWAWNNVDWFREGLTSAWEWIVGVWEAAPGFFSGLWDTVVGFFVSAKDWIVENFMKWHPLGIIISNWDAITGYFSSVKDRVIGSIRSAKDWVIENFMKWTPLGQIISNWDEIIEFFKGLPQRFRDAMSTIKDTLVSPFKSAFNAIASAWNRGPGRLNFTTPDWVPGFGGNSWGMPSIPMLAKGALLTGPTLFYGGEGGEPEGVMPISKIYAMVDQHVESRFGAAGDGGAGVTIGAVNVNNSGATPADIARAIGWRMGLPA